jgi:predicted nucleic acid-binding protein
LKQPNDEMQDAGTSSGGLIVLDASSLTSLLLDPKAGEHSVVRGARLLAPSLLPYEVTNVLRRLQATGRLASRHATQAFSDLATLDIDYWAWALLAERTWQLRTNLSSYDAAYVALAERTDALLVTRDARLARAPGIGCEVKVLS